MTDDPLSAAHGLVNGLLISGVMWLLMLNVIVWWL